MDRRLDRARRIAKHACKRFIDDRCLVGASALSYASLVSMIPLTALALVVFSGFPVFEPLRDQLLETLLDNFAPSIGDQAVGWFTFAASNAARSTAVGIGSLVVTSVLLLVTIEDQLHLIFHVTKPRPWAQRIAIYWTVLTMGPVLIGVGLSVAGELDGVFRHLTESHPVVAAARDNGTGVLRWFVPFVLETTAIALLLGLVPNCKVAWRDSLAGAAIAAVLLQLLKFAFVIFISRLASYSRVYGALAGIPIFLLWMYIFWIALLVGAEVTASLTRHAMMPIMAKQPEQAWNRPS